MAEKPKMTEEERIQHERNRNAKGGFFLNAAVWLLSRLPFTKNSYQNWTAGRRILIGWLLWIVCLPIIPAVAIVVWYMHDPEGFKKSPWAKGLIALFILWLGAFGLVATEKPQFDQNGKYSPTQTAPNGEIADPKSPNANNSEAIASDSAKKKVEKSSKSEPTKGRKFENCTAAFEAGVFDIKRSDPAYENRLDRDNDGIACER